MINHIKNIIGNYSPVPLNQKNKYAVLLPLVQHNDEWHILYEVRSEHISQPGEVAFPGGRVEKDESFQQAAIREASEELLIQENDIAIIGEIDYIINQRMTLHCFVGQLLIDDWQTIHPNEEVARLFTIPIKHLLKEKPQYHQLKSTIQTDSDFPFERIPNGNQYNFHPQHRHIPFYNINNENLWGLTAQLTHRFCEILQNDTSI